jgi:hypothetical protein
MTEFVSVSLKVGKANNALLQAVFGGGLIAVIITFLAWYGARASVELPS